jgi:hypothetical protein
MPPALELIERPDGTITNQTNGDPAASRVIGHRRFWVAADLGQANDYTAVCVIEDEQLPVLDDGKCILGPRSLTVVHADRFRGVSYVSVVDFLVRMKNAVPFGGKSQLVIDGTSLGRVVSDMMSDQGVPHIAIQMTAGSEWRRSGKYVNASKSLMIENTAVLFATGELNFAPELELKADIEADLGSFTLTETSAGNQVISQNRSAGGHGDLGIALVVGAFAAQYLKPQGLVEGRLKGWF